MRKLKIKDDRKIEMIGVKSTNVAQIGYHADTRILRIRFVKGATYDYSPVPPEVHQALMEATSKGQALRQLVQLNPEFSYKRIA